MALPGATVLESVVRGSSVSPPWLTLACESPTGIPHPPQGADATFDFLTIPAQKMLAIDARLLVARMGARLDKEHTNASIRWSIAVFPGAFDPVTHGHLDIIRRASGLFETLIVAIGVNPLKTNVFSSDERKEMLLKHTRQLSNIRVETYTDLTVNFARSVGARVILRGIRDTVDLHAELQIANTNLIIGDIETIFLMTSHEHVLTSSTLIKQIAGIGCEAEHLARLVPPDVAERLLERLQSSDELVIPQQTDLDD